MNVARAQAVRAEQRRSKRTKKQVASYVAVIVLIALTSAFIMRAFTFFPVVVLTGSMTGAIDAGSVVLIEKLQPEKVYSTVNLGDVIHLRRAGFEVVHRVVGFSVNDAGDRVYITKGDANLISDAYAVEPAQVLGVARAFIPYVGYPIIWIKSFLT